MGAIEHVLDPIEMHNVLLKMFHHLGHGQFCSEYRSVGLAAGHDDLENFTGVFVLVWFVTYSLLILLYVSLSLFRLFLYYGVMLTSYKGDTPELW